MNRKATIDSLFARKSDSSDTAVSGSVERVKTGALFAMGGSLKELAEGARYAERLREQIDAGATIVDLDTGLIDQSEVADRIAAEIDPAFEELVASINANGQQVPVLVRPVGPERYQIAYGRRRLKACQRLGIKVKAVVRKLTDEDLIIAQGKENLERLDLSFIEKAMFARRLEERGFDRSVIMAALATDKGDLSRFISVAKQIPDYVVQAIGPAGRVGRPRWLALAKLIQSHTPDEIVAETLQSESFCKLGSNERFAMLFGALSWPTPRTPSLNAIWTNGRGQKAARIDYLADRTIMTIDESVVPEFGRFLTGRLDEIYVQYLEHKKT